MIQSTIKVFEITHTKSQKLKINVVITIDQVLLFWRETGMLSLYPKWLPSKLIIKSAALKMHCCELTYFNLADTTSQ